MGKSLKKSLRIYVAKMKGEERSRRGEEGVESVNRSSGATLRDVDRFLLENFSSMYARREEDNEDEVFNGTRVNEIPPPPGEVDRRAIMTAKKSPPSDRVSPGGGVPVVIFTRDPCEDFRKSMEEMLRWRSPFDWDFAEELFFRYLEFNHRSSHRDILRAFCNAMLSIQAAER